ncbi:hypothetical protein QUG02_00265 [Bacillus hominis]|uniref:Phage holin n=1 Tax=Bacillus hominis TaxID=2817478 RepID=A0ABT7R180_9BACI|nr:hypothetical protein [Bacillus hominis]MDM5436682.1 hypothetical protein [Bacillus hominis]
MEIKDLFDLLHDPIQGALTIILTAYANKLVEEISDRSNKRTAPKAGKRKGGSKQK